MKGNKIYVMLTFLCFLFVTFFSLKINTFAANFKYSDFNWDELLEQNKHFWVNGCKDDDQDCYDTVLATKKEFYTRLYELLTEYQKKGFYIDDNIVIETVFFGLGPDSFRDPDVEADYNPFYIDTDDSTKNKFIGGDDGDKDTAKEYFEKETDSLKTLLNSFIGYKTSCYGISDEVPTVDSETGNKSCSGNLAVYDDKCIEKINDYEGTFFDSLGLSLFGLLGIFGNGTSTQCIEDAKDKGYEASFTQTNKTLESNEKFFYESLKTSKYLDQKKHLQTYYDVILQRSGYKNMDEFYKAAEDNPELLEKYEDDIIEAREGIIKKIQSVVENFKDTNNLSDNFNNTCNSDTTYWWPIGSSDVTDNNGVKTAIGDPISTSISSNFGARTSPTSNASENHKGLDIAAEKGTTPVIAVQSGTVVSGASGGTGNCTEGDTSCGSGYGNYVMIQHTDGNYTLYAHMDTNSVIVNEGDTVTQGQVIGYVGSTGNSTGGHLHFEVRVGGNDANSVQDPLNYINASSPRSASSCGNMSELSEFIANLEGGSTASDGNYIVENVGDGYRTFGHGIVVDFNADIIAKHGYNPSSLSFGDKVDKAAADAMYEDVIKEEMEAVKGKVSQNGITGLNDNQLAALVSLKFNCGNINGFVDAYKQYGATEGLCTNWWHNKALHDGNGVYYPGLAKRRKAECDLFVNGNYNMNVYG